MSDSNPILIESPYSVDTLPLFFVAGNKEEAECIENIIDSINQEERMPFRHTPPRKDCPRCQGDGCYSLTISDHEEPIQCNCSSWTNEEWKEQKQLMMDELEAEGDEQETTMYSREVAVYVNGRFYQRMSVPLKDNYVTIYAVTSQVRTDAIRRPPDGTAAMATMKQFHGAIRLNSARDARADIVSDELDFEEDGGLVLKEREVLA